MKLANLSLPQRLAAGLGCVVILALIVGAALFTFFEYTIGRRIAVDIAQAPVGWADSLRAWGRLDDVAEFALPRTDSGDGSAVAHDTTLAWHHPGIEHAYRVLLGGGGVPTADDSAAWRDARADTALNRFVRAAARRDWHALDRVIATADTGFARNILLMPHPSYVAIRTAGRALVIRGVMRLERGDRAGARTDFAAAVSLGDQMFRHEPMLSGALVGRAIMSSGLRGWERYGQTVRDTALAGRAARASARVSARLGRAAELLITVPDSALALAGDTGLPLGLRAEALVDALVSSLLRPRGFVFGVSHRHAATMRALASDPDRDFARIAVITAATAGRTGLFGVGGLIRETQRGQ